MTGRTLTMYEAAGGEETFTRLIDRLYAGVAADPVLRPLYPEDDEELARAAEHLRHIAGAAGRGIPGVLSGGSRPNLRY